jgi:glycosyltransferase involved in cell wall biosynthesis
MKVLLLSYHPPLYQDVVDHVLPSHLKGLAPHVDFILLCMVGSLGEARALTSAVGDHCRRIETVVSPMPAAAVGARPMTPAFLVRGIRNILSAAAASNPWRRLASAPTSFYYSKAYSARLKAIVAEERPDLVHFQDMVTSTHWRDVPDRIPRIFCPVDCISRWYHEAYRVALRPDDKCARYGRFLETRAWERFVIPKFRTTVLVSPTDARWLAGVVPGSRVDVVSLCVDTDHYQPLPVPEDNPSVLFTGVFTYPSNREALGYFVRDILPGIRREVPSLRFHIVGENPDAAIRGLSADRRNVVMDSVADIRSAMAAATVSVAPMRSGTGVKLKVLRAMAMAKPVVATQQGIEGLSDVRDQEHLLVADTSEQFIRHVVRLLRSARMRRQIGDRARTFIIDHHSVESWANRFLQIYQEAV